MNNEPIEDNDMPAEIDFSKGVRGLHHIPSDAKVLMPASIERTVWEHFSGKAEQRGVDLSELLTEVLKRDIEINEALKEVFSRNQPSKVLGSWQLRGYRNTSLLHKDMPSVTSSFRMSKELQRVLSDAAQRTG